MVFVMNYCSWASILTLGFEIIKPIFPIIIETFPKSAVFQTEIPIPGSSGFFEEFQEQIPGTNKYQLFPVAKQHLFHPDF